MSAKPCDSLFERVMAALPAWMLLLCGATMVAMVTLTPAWVASRQLDWQLQFMQAQRQQLEAQQTAYEQFRQAMRQGDPVLLERMAFYHLRLKPAGVALIDQTAWVEAAGRQAEVAQAALLLQDRPWRGLPTTEDLLAPPMPDARQFDAKQAVPTTRLVRLATGAARPWLLAFGVLCLFVGLLPSSTPARPVGGAVSLMDEEDEDTHGADGDDGEGARGLGDASGQADGAVALSRRSAAVVSVAPVVVRSGDVVDGDAVGRAQGVVAASASSYDPHEASVSTAQADGGDVMTPALTVSAEVDPSGTSVVGAAMGEDAGAAWAGDGPWLVAEMDESPDGADDSLSLPVGQADEVGSLRVAYEQVAQDDIVAPPALDAEAALGQADGDAAGQDATGQDVAFGEPLPEGLVQGDAGGSPASVDGPSMSAGPSAKA